MRNTVGVFLFICLMAVSSVLRSSLKSPDELPMSPPRAAVVCPDPVELLMGDVMTDMQRDITRLRQDLRKLSSDMTIYVVVQDRVPRRRR